MTKTNKMSLAVKAAKILGVAVAAWFGLPLLLAFTQSIWFLGLVAVANIVVFYVYGIPAILYYLDQQRKAGQIQAFRNAGLL